MATYMHIYIYVLLMGLFICFTYIYLYIQKWPEDNKCYHGDYMDY